MGIAYDNEHNYFNAIKSYETAIVEEQCLMSGLNNIAVTMTKIGMQQEALSILNRSISNYENKKSSSSENPWIDYCNRAKLFRILGNEMEMQKDIQQSFLLKPKYANPWIELGKFHLKLGELEKSEEAFTAAVNAEPSKYYFWLTRGEYYEITKQFEKAVIDYTKAYELSPKKTFIIYQLGYMYYLNSNTIKAEECYNKSIEDGEIYINYNEIKFQYGIIISIDHINGYGNILAKTFYNDYDNIYFKFEDASYIPNNGDRVKFVINYSSIEKEFSTFAINVSLDNSLNFTNFKRGLSHAIISVARNAFKATESCKYIELFYPHRAILPYSLIENQISDDMNIKIKNLGYLFVSLFININPSKLPELRGIRPLKSGFPFNNKFVTKRSSNKNYFGNNRFNSNRNSMKYCRVCGMNEWCGTNGCPNDPT